MDLFADPVIRGWLVPAFLLMLSAEALESRMRDLPTPALVVFGTHDRVMRWEMGRLSKEVLPNGHRAFVHDAAHAIAAERPQAFVELAAGFLVRQEGFVIRRSESVIQP